MRYCKDITGCTDFTFEPEFGLCIAYDSCPDTSVEFCQDCVSGNLLKCTNCFDAGEFYFSKIIVQVQVRTAILLGLCLGPTLSATVTNNAQECLALCQQRPNCEWYTFFEHDGGCFLTTDCDFIDETCSPDCWHGKRGCEKSGKISKIVSLPFP